MADKTEYIISLKDLFSKGIKDADNSAKGFEGTIRSLKGAIATLGIGIGAGALAKEIFQAGTNMDSLNISLKTMLGNKAAADKLVSEMVNFAATTPFQQDEVATAGKQLLAYGIEAKNIVPTLKALGDVSAGLAQPIGEIAYLYGTIKTQGRAMTMDIRQFANRGIPIYEELAKVTGKAGTKLQALIEDGKIGFPEIQKAFENMSSAGGKFYNLTTELSKTTGGQWSNMQDQLIQLAVTTFKVVQPAINWFIQAMTDLIATAKEVVKWIGENKKWIINLAYALGIAWGVYKAVNAIKKLNIWYTGLSTAAIVINTFVTEGWTSAQLALNMAMEANPIGLVVLAVAALAFGIKELIDYYDELRQAYIDRMQDNKVRAINDEVKAVNDLAIAYQNQNKGMSVKEARAKAFELETKGIAQEIKNQQAAIDQAKKAYAEAGILDKEKYVEQIRVATESYNITAAKRQSLADIKNSFLAGKTSGKGSNIKVDTGTDSVKGTEHKVITINIDKLIEKFSINSTNLQEGAASVKEQITKALIEALNDSQIVGAG